jgi:poly-beta-1,6-N-acetyl-D-glucosamine synthase
MLSLIFYILTLYFIAFYLYALTISKNQISETYYRKEEITVIIPFRNEAENLKKMIKSINELKSFPKEFIFIDDHSEDESFTHLKKLSDLIPYQIISLQNNQIGKKTAIREAVKHINTDFFLTWDADIVIQSNYFNAIEKIEKTDLLVLPVRMKSQSFFGFFYELDFYQINALSYALSKFYRPIVASGANLLVNTEKFKSFDSFQKHQTIASGDDQFLLNDFVNNKCKIACNFGKELIVETETPDNFTSFFSQRIRWAKKSILIKDYLAMSIGFVGFIIQILFLICLTFYFNWYLLIFKIGVDFLFFIPYLYNIKRLKLIVLIPFYSVMNPIYLLLMSFLSFSIDVRWKGRLN